ncbi:NADH:flavin oxidoreductase/NADH oxidase [Ketogulonicigenium vulgare]|uniref:NADH:flavin oxidoreductase/NADH oxidase n=1 Tax=Ketogulonicigenium vulgare TaxID=92945 RepID=UPI0023586216|nr:NADH:flavin oxidoreductase/NADH oxidase [Ketogulonicigenium vulgare]
MSKPALFTPLRLRNLDLANRIVIAPMCQYSAVDGCMTDWHISHLGALAQSGAGLLTIEATAVVPEGRITYADVGLYNDRAEAAMAKTLDSVRKWSDMPIAIQLAHAGRKASTDAPWLGRGPFAPDHPNGWQTEAPSAIPYDTGAHPPVALDADGLKRVRDGFVDAARRAARLGIDAVQIHAAHGYLLHTFLSPLANQRTDAYGGSLENRARFPLEVLDAVRAVFPADRAVTVRISATDWVEGGFTLDEAIAVSQMLEAHGADAINVSTGGLHPAQAITPAPGYQVPHARAIKAAVNIPVVAVGLITEPTHAEAIIANGEADLIGIARTVIYNPRWPWHAAAALGGQVSAAPQYMRCMPSVQRNAFVQRGA